MIAVMFPPWGFFLFSSRSMPPIERRNTTRKRDRGIFPGNTGAQQEVIPPAKLREPALTIYQGKQQAARGTTTKPAA
jgi:hypothetical protein